MKIALIYPPYSHKKFAENVREVDDRFGLLPPINLAYAAAIMENVGHKVILIDANASKLSKEKVFDMVKKFNPDVMGYNLNTYMFYHTLDWIHYFKERNNLPVIVGGVNLLYYPEETMTHREIDYAIIGEAIHSLPELLGSMEKGKGISSIDGIAFRKNGQAIIAPPVSRNGEDLDSLPHPARHLLPNEKYYSYVSQRKNFTVMLSSFGCPYSCLYCAIFKLKPFRMRPPEAVVNEIEECYRKYGVREIDFFDGVMLINKERAMEISKEIKKRNIDLYWSCRSRVDLVDEELLKEIASSGCKRVFYGIESSDPKVLKAMNKYIPAEKIKENIRLTKKYGIRPLGFFMTGCPEETEESLKKTVRFAKELGLDYAQFSRTIPKPKTGLDRMVIEKTGRDFWRDYILEKVGEERIPTVWSKFSEEKLEKLTKWAYFSFYFRPFYLLRTLLKTRSIGELMRYIKVGIKMLYSFVKIEDSNKENNKYFK